MIISLVIPVYNSEQYIRKLIDSIIAQKQINLNVEIIFVDNNSTDNSLAIIKEHLKNIKSFNILTLFYNNKQSSYAARNFGIKHARGDIICFTDADCVLDVNYFSNLHKLLRKSHNKIISGHVELLISDKKNIWENFDKEVNMRNEKKIEKNSAATANLIVPKVFFSEVGDFLEITSGGDIEWTKRAVNLGKSIVFSPQVKVFHPCRKTWKETKEKMYRLGIGYGEKSNYKLVTILKAFFRLFYFPTNVKISSAIFKNIGFFKLIIFNIYFLFLRIIQLNGVIRGAIIKKEIRG